MDSGVSLHEFKPFFLTDIQSIYTESRFKYFVHSVLHNHKLNFDHVSINHDSICIYSKNEIEPIAELIYDNPSSDEYVLDYDVKESYRGNGLAKFLFLLAFSLPQDLNIDTENISFGGYLININLCAFYDKLFHDKIYLNHEDIEKLYDCDERMHRLFSKLKPNMDQLLLAFKNTPHYKIMSFLGFEFISFEYCSEPGDRHLGCYFKPPQDFNWGDLALTVPDINPKRFKKSYNLDINSSFFC